MAKIIRELRVGKYLAWDWITRSLGSLIENIELTEKNMRLYLCMICRTVLL